MNILELLPSGKMWEGENTKNLFLSLGDSCLRIKGFITILRSEIFPDSQSDLFLDKWTKICNANSKENILAILAASGGNQEDFFLEIAKKYDNQCQILKTNPSPQFVAGISTAGQSLSGVAIPRFSIFFQFSVGKPLTSLEKLLEKLKPAHVKFVYIYSE